MFSLLKITICFVVYVIFVEIPKQFFATKFFHHIVFQKIFKIDPIYFLQKKEKKKKTFRFFFFIIYIFICFACFFCTGGSQRPAQPFCCWSFAWSFRLSSAYSAISLSCAPTWRRRRSPGASSTRNWEGEEKKAGAISCNFWISSQCEGGGGGKIFFFSNLNFFCGLAFKNFHFCFSIHTKVSHAKNIQWLEISYPNYVLRNFLCCYWQFSVIKIWLPIWLSFTFSLLSKSSKFLT